MTLYLKTVSVIFALVAILHVLRLVNQWDAIIGGWSVPMWFSIPAFIFAAALSVAGFKYSCKK